MARPRKNVSAENAGESAGRSATPRRKRTSSAEMSGLDKKTQTRGSRKASGSSEDDPNSKRKSERNNEYESPEKRRGYDENLRDDYNQSGARYTAGERGQTEFEYDQRNFSGRGESWYDDRGREHDPREHQRERRTSGYDRESYFDPGIESDYRHHRRRRNEDSEYMSGRGDVPSGGYYGNQRMGGQDRGYDQGYGRESRGEYGNYDEYGNTSGGWSNRAAWDRDRDYNRGDIDRRTQGMSGRRAGYETGYGRQGMSGSYDNPQWSEGDYGSGSYRGYDDRGPRRSDENDFRMGSRDSWNVGNYGERGKGERYHGGGSDRPHRHRGGHHPRYGYDL